MFFLSKNRQFIRIIHWPITGIIEMKINAAKIATNAGIDMIIMNGRDPEKLYDLFEDKEIGTLFKSQY